MKTAKNFNKILIQIISAFGGCCTINSNLELILIPETGAYINLSAANTETDLKRLLLVSVCRDCFKTQRFKHSAVNNKFHEHNLMKLNKALGTNFTKDDMQTIYQNFGNFINQDLATLFVESDYDIKILRKYADEY